MIKVEKSILDKGKVHVLLNIEYDLEALSKLDSYDKKNLNSHIIHNIAEEVSRVYLEKHLFDIIKGIDMEQIIKACQLDIIRGVRNERSN